MKKWLRLILLVFLVWGVWYACRSGKSTVPNQKVDSQVHTTSAVKEDPCKGLSEEVSQAVIAISENLSAQQLAYNSLPFTDCSGIFHRVLDSLKQRCPEQKFPDKSYRSSRALARWYHEQGTLSLVHNPLQMSERLRPGAVVFFGRIEAGSEASLTIESLTQSGGINHVGVVTSVSKDASGTIQNYQMFHGLRPGKVAKITTYHNRTPTRETYPPYGNGNQAWVAVAPIVGK